MQGKRVLIVEDDAEFRELLRSILEEGGFEVQHAVNGAEGLEALKSARPDVVILDVEMPRMTGYQVTEAVRADPDIASTPIILCTVQSKMDQVIKGMKLGANDHITKPFDPDEVLVRVRGVLKAAGS